MQARNVQYINKAPYVCNHDRTKDVHDVVFPVYAFQGSGKSLLVQQLCSESHQWRCRHNQTVACLHACVTPEVLLAAGL